MLEKRVKPELFRGNIVVKASPIHGYGVFAMQDFHQDDLIEECYSLLINDKKAAAPVELENYLFDADAFSSLALGNGCIYNHMDKPNATYEFDTESALMTIRASKYIRKGEEIFISYGQDWFGLRKMKAYTSMRYRLYHFIAHTRFIYRFAFVTGMIFALIWLMKTIH